MGRTSEILMKMYEAMRERFGHQGWWPGETPFEIAVGAILTQNTTWTNVEKAISNLRSLNALDYEGMCGLDDETLLRAIRPAGYFNQKVRKLRNLLSWLGENCGGKIEELASWDISALREGLLGISGIGPETADSIILYAVGKPTFVVDAYTARILTRHEMITPDASYDDIKELFEDNLPVALDLYQDYHAQFVMVGKTCCRKKSPSCSQCPLLSFLRRPISMPE